MVSLPDTDLWNIAKRQAAIKANRFQGDLGLKEHIP